MMMKFGFPMTYPAKIRKINAENNDIFSTLLLLVILFHSTPLTCELPCERQIVYKHNSEQHCAIIEKVSTLRESAPAENLSEVSTAQRT